MVGKPETGQERPFHNFSLGPPGALRGSGPLLGPPLGIPGALPGSGSPLGLPGALRGSGSVGAPTNIKKKNHFQRLQSLSISNPERGFRDQGDDVNHLTV